MLGDYSGSSLYRNRFKFQFGTQTRWIEGNLTSAHRRLLDVLNSHHGGLLLCEGVSVCNCAAPSVRLPVAELGQVNTSAILIAVPTEESADSRMKHDPSVMIRKRPEGIRLGLGPYEVLGHIYLVENARLTDAFSTLTDRFVAVTRAVVTRVDDPSFKGEYPVVFVNRQEIDYVIAAT